ncbi:hypothetical protein AKJ16_DCAP26332 [Drosera capensis]
MTTAVRLGSNSVVRRVSLLGSQPIPGREWKTKFGIFTTTLTLLATRSLVCCSSTWLASFADQNCVGSLS